jgi:hypothetical protein
MKCNNTSVTGAIYSELKTPTVVMVLDDKDYINNVYF